MRGILIPSAVSPIDLAMVGMGDFPISKYASLSTMHESLRELGATAAEMVLDLIESSEIKVLHRRSITMN